MTWRKANNIDLILETYQEPEVIAKYWPGGICGCDKDGRPVQIDRFGAIDLRGDVIFGMFTNSKYRSCKHCVFFVCV